MSELNEVSRLKEELEAMKVIAKGYEQMIEKYFANADDKPKEETRDTRYDALLEELEFNDKMAGKETTKEVPNKVPLIYQDFLNELKENDELLNNTIK